MTKSKPTEAQVGARGDAIDRAARKAAAAIVHRLAVYAGVNQTRQRVATIRDFAEIIAEHQTPYRELVEAARWVDAHEIETCEGCDGSGEDPNYPGDAHLTCGGCGEIVTGELHPQEVRDLRTALARIDGEG